MISKQLLSLTLPLFLLLSLPCLLEANVAAADSAASQPLVVIMIGEPEYQTEETLPKFAEQFLQNDYRVEYVLEDPAKEHVFENIERINDADVLVISVRRKTLPTAQLAMIRRFIAAGKPVVGIRTANHAFSLLSGDAPVGSDQWLSFDADVFGGNYTGHHANGLTSIVTFAPFAGEHPIVAGMPESTWQQTGSLYKTSPLAENTHLLLIGAAEGTDQEPVAWTFVRADGGRSFYTSLGHRADFENPALAKLLRQAIDWAVRD
jgi:type 1 glutamine amidotransferase